jgi:hypothetical protein
MPIRNTFDLIQVLAISSMAAIPPHLAPAIGGRVKREMIQVPILAVTKNQERLVRREETTTLVLNARGGLKELQPGGRRRAASGPDQSANR